MAHEIPDHVIEQYGSARAFKAKKRAVVKEMRRLASELALGAAYLPNGYRSVTNVEYELQILAKELSVKNWGR